MIKGIADIDKIQEALSTQRASDISNGTGISIHTIKKLKSGERSIEKINLADAIKLTEFAEKNRVATIEIWK